MVDWEAVERLRSKGWDWDRIADDPKVGFHAEEGAGDPGRALRALYYQRRSKAQRKPAKGDAGSAKAGGGEPKAPWNLARIGYLLVPALGLWFLLAYVYPSPVGTYLPAIPYLGLALAAAAFLLFFGLLRTDERWSRAMRTSVIGGVVLGIVLAGGITLVAEVNQCPVLSPISGSEPQGWERSNAAAWTEGGKPVFFFVGSIACPYCSASSWAMWLALQAFGPVSGTSFATSNPNDHPLTNIPEVNLGSAQISSQYVTMVVLEGQDDLSITIPPTGSCTQQAYVSAYDTGGSIPFLVINGQYVHVGTIVDPTVLQPYTPSQVYAQLQNHSDPAWSAVSPSMYLMEAFLVKANGGNPTSVATDPNVASLLSQIT